MSPGEQSINHRGYRGNDVSLEQLALRQTGNLFEEIFGFPVQIRSLRRSI